MLGHTYPPYRQRRSFKKYYYALFAILTIVLYRSGAFSSARYAESEEFMQQFASRRSETLEGDRNAHPDSSRMMDGFGHHVHPQPKHAEDLGNRYALGSPQATPAINGPAFQQKDIARVPGTPHIEDDTDNHDVDDIETIRGHSAEKVEDSGKLKHPDDGAETDGEHTNSGASTQIRLGQNDKVNELLKEEHSLKEVHSEVIDIDTDLDEPVETNDDATQFPIQTLKEMTPFSETYTFPSWDECQTVKAKADDLPDMVHIPFEQAVADVVLEGWEDEWIAKARYTGPRLEEPKIDFVYNCTLLLPFR